MANKNDQPTYYINIPAKVRYDKRLTPGQILLFGEITALSNKNGFCNASNTYFARLYSVDPTTVSKWVKGLKKFGFISLDYEYDGKQIKQRKMKPSEGIDLIQGGIESDQEGTESDQGGSESGSRGVVNENQGGSELKPKKNNTRDNNTRKNNNSIETDSDESISCLSDKDAFDWDLIDLKTNDYPKNNEQGKILRFTIWFHGQVMENFSHHKTIRQANLYQWKEHIRLMLEQDHISLDDQLVYAKWVFADSFWKTQIRSTGNFRDKIESIDAAMIKEDLQEQDKTDKRRKFTRYEGEMLMLDNGLLKSERSGGGYEFDDLFEHVSGAGAQAQFVIKKSCLNLFKTWNR